ncbi:hypothetical protein CONPUDRAFT_96619 [Coniophora puteana RWD-64-598 SS2]|uniref:non-specific serine/threonine protein kinase n=1 Tax=Coniophora puteana (strain RWD-64-598) TaxID=741705 RepID=A0A5M3N8U9_CONPW|nr:uncharacterized protein CONPUDRAFT_96619 [Coniophora puteana RWD-64-598 SS2]EIW87265.1 hypothetical protein CONPUDRAFT_96619 [Coniophora puteana RWD-64-598 SS2]
MKGIDATHPRPMRRQPVRMDGDGPWTVSVAENPNDTNSFSIYIKTPTHNLTLMRTAHEVIDLHGKLDDLDSDAHPRLPPLPLDVSTMTPVSKTKRKSNFLNTISRLASPSVNKDKERERQREERDKEKDKENHRGKLSRAPSHRATPTPTPSHEHPDPFVAAATATLAASANGGAPNAVTGLASYLTSVSNDQVFRQSRVWKRFVHVRRDDLESVRVERAIKRVRSDLAAHVSPKLAPPLPSHSPSEVSDAEGEADAEDSEAGQPEGIKEEAEAEAEAEQTEGEVESTAVDSEAQSQIGDGHEEIKPVPPTPIDTAQLHGDEALSTPTAESANVASRIPRSQSADPSSRLSRAYTSSTLQDGASTSATNTGDEDASSISTEDQARRRRKKSRVRKQKSSPKLSQRKVVIDDFEMMRVLGKGCAGKVLLVRHKNHGELYALKAITKRHVLAHQELQHTLTEQAVLKRMAAESRDPFVVKLWWSFHDKENLFLVMDFHPGGDLATQLARWGRLGRDRARFYAAEIVEGVEGLHAAGVIYRDLKPENILIAADGHIVLTDFGLSKEFPRKTSTLTAPSTPSGTRSNGMDYVGGGSGSPSPSAVSTPTTANGANGSANGASEPVTPPWMHGEGELRGVGPADTTSTFCGTAEYLAPEVIQGLPYSYEVDWWSFGTMLYEMLTGITPFWANNHSDMYVRVLQDELTFPDDRAMDQDTKSLIRGLLQRNPALRMCEPRIKKHPYFSMIDWSHVYYKRYIPPYIPPIDPSNASDTQNFDDTFLDMEPIIDDPTEGLEDGQTDTDQDQSATDGEDSATTPSHSRSPSVHATDDGKDVFDGYSFKGRHSVIIDDEEDDGSDEDEEDEDDEIVGEDEDEELPDVIKNATVDGEEVVIQPSPIDRLPVVEDDEVEQESRTPEARTTGLPAEAVIYIEASPKAVNAPLPPSPVVTPRLERPRPQTPTSANEVAPAPPPKDKDVKPAKGAKPSGARHPHRNSTRPRREKSGVAVFDQELSDGGDEELGMSRSTVDDEDDDWDFIEAVDGEDRNGAKGTSLFARGVVDRYRLAVWRKASTPTQRGGAGVSGRSTSGLSSARESDIEGGSEIGSTLIGDSPSPSEKRRGRTPGALKFRRNTKGLLNGGARSTKSSTTGASNVSTPTRGPPPSSFAGAANVKKRNTLTRSTSASTAKTHAAAKPVAKGSSAHGSSTLGSSASALASASSMGALSSSMAPSLKSKQSAVSVGARSMSSDQSNGNGINGTGVNGELGTPELSTPGPSVPTSPSQEEPEKLKNKKLKKYKENAEKVFSSMFASPR